MASTFSTNQSVKITKTVIDRLKPPPSGQAFLRDTELKGFGVRVTANGAVAFIVEKRIDGRVRRKTLGRFGVLTVEQARRLAQGFLGDVAKGENPIAKKEAARVRQVTLADAFAMLLRARKSLSPKTRYDYERFMTVPLAGWAGRRLVDIRRTEVLERHRALGEASGPYYANRVMRFVSSVFNFALAHYADAAGNPVLTHNPVLILSQTRAWYPEARRDRVLTDEELARLYPAIEALRRDPAPSAETVADLLLFLLFTGLRIEEALGLAWDRVDLAAATVRIEATKNGSPLLIPVSTFVHGLLARRHREAVSGFVFPGPGPRGRLVEPRRQIRKACAAADVQFRPHDLRRTYLTIGTRLRIGRDLLKRLVNHRTEDVTGGYIILDVEDLREPAARIGRYLEGALRIPAVPVVVPLRPPREVDYA